MTDATTPKRRMTVPAIVGVAAGIVSIAVGSITIYRTIMPSGDEFFAEMISTAEGMEGALTRIAGAIEADPDVVGSEAEQVKELAVTANTVTQSVQEAAQSKGIRIASTDLWGERFRVKDGVPIMLQSPRGQMFGIANAQFSGVNLNNKWYSASDGSIIEFKVKDDACTAFVHTNTSDVVDVTVRCED